MAVWGKLGDYVSAVGAKTLSRTDIDRHTSHGHELAGNGTGLLKQILGDEDRKAGEGNGIPTLCIYLSDNEEPSVAEFQASWYDARRYSPSNRSPEWRLYYKDCDPIEKAKPGDLTVFSKLHDGRLLILMASKGSSAESRTRWLFGIDDREDAKVRLFDRTDADIDAFGAQILGLLGVEVNPRDDDELEKMVALWGYSFPTGKDFAKWAQDSLKDVDPSRDDPDAVLMAYYEQEYKLFRIFERAVIQHEYEEAPFVDGTTLDVDSFTEFYKHVRNRRVSRAGTSLEQHVERILKARKIEYSAQERTEGTKKPDFLFPSVKAYRDQEFDSTLLRMLAAKTSTKDRWRQVIDEADRIERKHLLTIAPAGVSAKQCDQMIKAKVTLVMPSRIKLTHASEVQSNTVLFSEFIDEVSGLHYA